MKMKTIVKTAKELAEILGVTERTITNRGKKLSLMVIMYRGGSHKYVEEYKKSHLAGYSCNRSGNPQRPRYTFFK